MSEPSGVSGDTGQHAEDLLPARLRLALWTLCTQVSATSLVERAANIIDGTHKIIFDLLLDLAVSLPQCTIFLGHQANSILLGLRVKRQSSKHVSILSYLVS